MSYMDLFKVPEPTRELSGKAAVVGVGESDYRADYQAARAKSPGYQGQTAETLATVAFDRALADSGLRHDEIDGLSVAFLYGGPTAAETAATLGLTPRYLTERGGGICAGPIPVACDALARGERVELRGFGAFTIKKRDARTGRNPRTGEAVPVDEKVVPFFKAGKELRERVNNGMTASKG